MINNSIACIDNIMTEKVIFFTVIFFIVILFLMFFQPIRQAILAVFGAKSIWGLLWALIAEIIVAHWMVIKNFMPRSFIYPTLDTEKSTNAEDE